MNKQTCLNCKRELEENKKCICSCCVNPKFYRLNDEDVYDWSMSKFWRKPILKSVAFVCRNCGCIEYVEIWSKGVSIEISELNENNK